LDSKKVRYDVVGNTVVVNQNLSMKGYSGTDLPEGLTVNGTLDLRGCAAVPSANMDIKKSLDLQGRKSIYFLPEGISIGHSLYLTGTSVEALPEDIKIGQNLFASSSNLTTIPQNVHEIVGGHVDIAFCHGEKEAGVLIPDGLRVNGNLYMAGSSLNIETMTIGGAFDFRGVKGSIPSKLSCKSLDLRACKGKEIPKTILVSSHIWIEGCDSALPESLTHLAR